MNIELDHNEIYHALRKEEFHASILQMQLEGAKDEQVLLRSVQWHAYKPQVLHVDFQRVDANQALRTKVPLHFVNAEVSPAVKLSGAIISHVATELEITCLPSALPQFIEVNLADILYLEALRNYVAIQTRTQKILTLQNLRSFEEILSPQRFVRVHKSFIVAIDKIDSVERQRIFTGPHTVPIGDTYVKQFYEAIRMG